MVLPTAKGDRLPPLTEEEKCLLHKNGGCFRCCCPFIPCRTSNCVEPFPDPTKYQPLTQAWVDAMKAAGAWASRPVATVAPGTAVPASVTVAAVLLQLPAAVSCVESVHSDSDSDSDVSDIPLAVLHLL